MTGEKKNCMKAHIVASTPNHSAACAVSPFRKRSMSFGSTGSTTPSASTSSTTVTKMKVSAAWRGPRGGVAEPAAPASELMDMMDSPGPRRIIGPTPAGPKRDPPAGSDARVPVLEQLHERGERLVHGRGHAQLRAAAGH